MADETLHDELSLSSLNEIFPWIRALTDDESVTEIMVVCARSVDAIRGDAVRVFFERRGELHGMSAKGAKKRDVTRLAMALARPLGSDPETTPLCDARLVDGSRVALCLPPATDTPAITIRRFSKVALTARQLVEYGSLPQKVIDIMGESLASGGNLLVAGGTGSGKTTLLNALIQMFPKTHRIVVIEDTIELRVDQPNTVRLEARQLSEFSLSIRDMVRHALRHRPDHIVVGEIRGPEARDVLQALNTGHGGSLTTIHANTACDALTRMVSCAMESGETLPWDVMARQVSSAFDLVAHQARRPDGSRGVKELYRVIGYDAATGEWRGESVWRYEPDAKPEVTVLPPRAVRRTADGAVRALPAGPGPSVPVPVAAGRPETLGPPPAAGLPSSSILALWPRRHVVVVPPADPDPEVLDAVAPVLVTYPSGDPVAPSPSSAVDPVPEAAAASES